MVEPVGLAGIFVYFIGPADCKACLFKARFNPSDACKKASDRKFSIASQATCLCLPNRNDKKPLLQLL